MKKDAEIAGLEGSDEEILARCIDRFADLGDSAVDEACAGDPSRAQRLRGRLATLQRLGLVASRGAGGAPASIGRYPILGILGEGGMGAVYLAFDEALRRNVAIKIGHVPMPAGPAGGASEAGSRARARFEREIRAVAKLEHPGIVSIHDVGESEGRPYFTMDLVRGVTLAHIVEELRDRRLGFDQLTVGVLQEIVGARVPPEPGDPAPAGDAPFGGATYVETVCRWTLEIADALAHAHAHAIVHRDVKPANVMVQRDGRTKLFDLGLARLGEEPGLTRSGDLAGSPYYMSPEQVSGPPERVDRRTDVYSLGVTLFELLTLRRPFEGPTSAQVFRQIASREPPLLRRINPLVPRDLETICLAALEKDPDRRYPTVEALAEDLRRFLAFAPIRATPPGALRRAVRFARRNPALASASGLAALVLVGLPVGLLLANAAIRAEQRRAEQEAQLKSRVTEFLVDQFHLSEEDRDLGATISARELLDRGTEKLEGAFEEDPLVRAELFAATGTVYANLGLYARAIPLLDRAVAIRQSAVGQDPRALADLFEALAAAHLAEGHAETARRLCERGLDLLREAKLARSHESVGLRRTLAEAALASGDAGEAERSLSSALETLRALDASPGEDEAAVLEKLGLVAFERGRLAPARERLAESLAVRRRAWSPEVGLIARGIGELAAVDEALGDRERAESGRRELARLTASSRSSGPAVRLPFDLRPAWEGEYEASFQDGITALQSRELPRAIEAFQRCLELDPTRSVCAYNVACGYALAGDVERGLEWLDRAADAGFGAEASRFQVAATDPEIANLRSLERGEAVLQRMRANGERIRAFAAEPAVRLLPGAADDELRPLLVVLHADGQTKLAVARGEWARVAESAGADLLAPSGALSVAADPEAGMRWLEEPNDLVRRSAECARNVMETVRTFLEDHPVDPDRVWIAGEGAGAMVAFEVALRAPGLFRGVILVDGPIHPDTSPDQARRAASLGLRAAFVLDAGTSATRLDSAALAARVREWLADCGFPEPCVLRRGEGADGGLALASGILRDWSAR
jgi:serine/threonine protein kinase/predicted esterase